MPPTPTYPMRTFSIGGAANSIAVAAACAASALIGIRRLPKAVPSPAAPTFKKSLRFHSEESDIRVLSLESQVVG